MKVFLDTNVWFSAVATPGLCENLVKRLFETHQILGSELVWLEFSDLLARKLRFSDEEIVLARAMFDEVALVADVPEPADDNDARLVAGAVAAGANLFVTGDKRVLGWQGSGTLRIVSPREAWVVLFAPHLKH